MKPIWFWLGVLLSWVLLFSSISIDWHLFSFSKKLAYAFISYIDGSGQTIFGFDWILVCFRLEHFHFRWLLMSPSAMTQMSFMFEEAGFRLWSDVVRCAWATRDHFMWQWFFSSNHTVICSQPSWCCLEHVVDFAVVQLILLSKM